MRAVIQRVSNAAVSVDGVVVASIQGGYVILLGIGHEDTADIVQAMVDKIAHLRINEDRDGKTNLSLLDTHGEILVISQFTLYADTRKGRRPSFTDAAKPDIANKFVELFVEKMKLYSIPVQQGIFGAHMQVALVNNGPMTIILEI